MAADLPENNQIRTRLMALRRFAGEPEAPERCQLCSAPLGVDHDHLVELASSRLVCACEACAILFSGQAVQKYRRVPRHCRFLPDFCLSDEAWEGLLVPIGLAFFVRRSATGRMVALYPSPAGATESLLSLESWQEIVADNPDLSSLVPDVEGLLVNRIGAAREYYRVGIDQCYALVGLIRKHWRGLSGGTAVWSEITGFFASLQQRSGFRGEMPHA